MVWVLAKLHIQTFSPWPNCCQMTDANRKKDESICRAGANPLLKFLGRAEWDLGNWKSPAHIAEIFHLAQIHTSVLFEMQTVLVNEIHCWYADLYTNLAVVYESQLQMVILTDKESLIESSSSSLAFALGTKLAKSGFVADVFILGENGLRTCVFAALYSASIEDLRASCLEVTRWKRIGCTNRG